MRLSTLILVALCMATADAYYYYYWWQYPPPPPPPPPSPPTIVQDRVRYDCNCDICSPLEDQCPIPGFPGAQQESCRVISSTSDTVVMFECLDPASTFPAPISTTSGFNPCPIGDPAVEFDDATLVATTVTCATDADCGAALFCSGGACCQPVGDCAKIGLCPASAASCGTTCTNDVDCDGIAKCCGPYTSCGSGRRCMFPLTA